MSSADYLNTEQLRRALSVRDLTDPAQGPHAIQLLLDAAVAALRSGWDCSVRYVRSSPVVPVRENYDRLGYDPGDVTRAPVHPISEPDGDASQPHQRRAADRA